VRALACPARLVTVLAALGPPAASGADDPSGFARYMDACVKADGFTGSVLVSRGGEVLFRAGYGLADAEHGVPNSPGTKFRLGSVTKQFTAMGVMVLAGRGKLRLDDPVGRYVDGAPKAWEKVTLHHLLSHTSGIPSYTSDPDYEKKTFQPETVRSMIDRFRDRPLEFAPGERFSYSNSGYFLLGAVIEKVTGKTYEAFLKDAVLDPLGMKDTGYDHFATVLPHRASGYARTPEGLENAEYLDMSQPYAAGALYSTVDDLAAWDRALAAGRLISKEGYARMFTPVKGGYAYGWSVTTRGARKEVGHGGGINGFVTQILRYPDQKVCVVVLCNVLPLDPGRVARDLAAVTFGEPYKLPEERKAVRVDPKVYDAYAGRYRLSPDAVLTVTREGDRLIVQPPGQPRLEVFPESEAEFFVKSVDLKFRFVRGGKGEVTHLVVRRGKVEEKAERLGDDEAEAPKGEGRRAKARKPAAHPDAP
jgi:CubicO group peptidase (beta-lactamase class C family)